MQFTPIRCSHVSEVTTDLAGLSRCSHGHSKDHGVTIELTLWCNHGVNYSRVEPRILELLVGDKALFNMDILIFITTDCFKHMLTVYIP